MAVLGEKGAWMLKYGFGTPQKALNKILHGGRYPDVIICANFGEDRLRGLGVRGG